MAIRSTALASSGANLIVNRLNKISGGKILDIGTGTGVFIGLLRQTLKDYESFIGIDLDDESLKKARDKRASIAEFFKMNAEKLDFPDNTFDMVCLANSLHHLEKSEKVLKEMDRVVKPQGYLVFQELYSNPEQTQAQLASMRLHHFEAKIDSLLGEYHRATYTKEEIKKMIQNLGEYELEVFDTSRPPQCLFCEDKDKCENPKDEELIEREIKYIQSKLKRVRSFAEYEQLTKEAEEIKEDLRENGLIDASALFILLKKQ